MDNIIKAKAIINSNIYMSIATASKDGKPWISPVFFAYDENFNLYWVSNKESLHSNLLRSNPQAAIVIFDSTAAQGEGDAVYIEAEVKELDDEQEIKASMQILSARVSVDEFRVKEVWQVMDKGYWRIYKAKPTSISKSSHGRTINGQYIDERVDIKLVDLKNAVPS
jgi:nitroimidazol reductase NimA-like FMN-containing flavoprotein (pyridoxamine 5'-phosphate oxidase superfamily)